MKSGYLKQFSHIYVERAAREYDETQRILERFKRSEVVPIEDHRDIFNRRRQRFQSQKQSMKLILAVKDEPYIYPGSHNAPNFGHENFYYNAMILNCVYNCEYCYLQGMYQSANIVVFVNSKRFFEAADEILKQYGSIYLCISYDTDLMAFENIVPYCRGWIQWANRHDGATIEIRTKSANFRAISEIPPPTNVVLAWTLSPQEICIANEEGTPTLRSRLGAIRAALACGWKVRICIDPILRVPKWSEKYQALLNAVFESVDAELVHDFSIGVFRMNPDHLERLQRVRSDSGLAHYPYLKSENTCSYEPRARTEMLDFVAERIRKKAPAATISCH